jgi:hypothetical protein
LRLNGEIENKKNSTKRLRTKIKKIRTKLKNIYNDLELKDEIENKLKFNRRVKKIKKIKIKIEIPITKRTILKF